MTLNVFTVGFESQKPQSWRAAQTTRWSALWTQFVFKSVVDVLSPQRTSYCWKRETSGTGRNSLTKEQKIIILFSESLGVFPRRLEERWVVGGAAEVSCVQKLYWIFNLEIQTCSRENLTSIMDDAATGILELCNSSPRRTLPVVFTLM